MSSAQSHPLGENLEDCTGCAACAGVCPNDSITMNADAEGFLYPQINPLTCDDCHLCRTICPVSQEMLSGDVQKKGLNQGKPLGIFAAWHLDEVIRRASSSGGVFTALADIILEHGGVVIGATLDGNFVVRHTFIEKSADLHRLRGSKYVQSQVSPSIYRRISELLTQGRPVLFSGTPCQVAAIRSSLRKPCNNLFCCDIVCHGVPSPMFLARYIQFGMEKGKKLVGVSFRDKTTGWKKFSVRWNLQNGRSNLFAMSADPYMAAFLRNFTLRLSCYACKFTSITRLGDLTIADFWGVANKYPEYDPDDKGTSLILVNTKKGQTWIDACRPFLFLGQADIETAVIGNPCLIRPSMCPPQRVTFYRDLGALPFNVVIRKYRLHPPSLWANAIMFFRRAFNYGNQRIKMLKALLCRML